VPPMRISRHQRRASRLARSGRHLPHPGRPSQGQGRSRQGRRRWGPFPRLRQTATRLLPQWPDPWQALRKWNCPRPPWPRPQLGRPACRVNCHRRTHLRAHPPGCRWLVLNRRRQWSRTRPLRWSTPGAIRPCQPSHPLTRRPRNSPMPAAIPCGQTPHSPGRCHRRGKAISLNTSRCLVSPALRPGGMTPLSRPHHLSVR
jgi:hypothetical protein